MDTIAHRYAEYLDREARNAVTAVKAEAMGQAAKWLRKLDVENDRLRRAIQQTLDENGHLADGENCTLIVLKRAIETPNAD